MIRVACLRSALILPALLFATSVQAAATPARTPSDSFVGELLAIVIPLVLIIAGLVFLLRVVRRRYGLSGSDAPLSVLQILPLGPRERLVLVKSRAGRVFAIGVGAHSVTFITDLDIDDLEAPAAAASLTTSHSMSNIDEDR
ncbi:FliO/MopB family protein [Luteimonas terrae]|uniref:Flagellar biogenesis protein FliO n=1 Tax=Luteimonas terrae TaxID=1530191 RepID=A0ABU1Y2M9_9GAMM|nr:flagellar biosynthetic protein FliO [Luteimonas terrae]MDR7194705.1 flagellar biogenesis protein FliO [Luteimonas terrae]